MKVKTAVVLLSGLLFACAPPQPPQASTPPAAPAQPPAPPPRAEVPPGERIVAIRSATCATMLNLSPDDRAMASMFYLGYQAEGFRTSTINVNAIPSMEALALSYCSAYPDRTVARAFAEPYLLGGR